MKHLKPYNKIYSMMCVVVCERVSRVYSCHRLPRVYFGRLSISYVFKRCLKICSHIYHVFRIFFLSCILFSSFSSDRYVFFMSKIAIMYFWTERFDTAVILPGDSSLFPIRYIRAEILH